MKFLNLGCGGCRPPHLNVPTSLMVENSPWVNVDDLHSVLNILDSPERKGLDSESNYLNADLRKGIPLETGSVDGILASHFFEHLDLQESIKMVAECKRVLRDGGVLRVSIPCPKKFHQLSVNGCADWGEKNPHKDKTYMNWALFFTEHKQLLTIESMFCLFWDAQFKDYREFKPHETWMPGLADLDNREIFSFFAEAIK